MIAVKNIGFKKFTIWTYRKFLLITLYTIFVAFLYVNEIITFRIPWLPMSVIATSVAFYLGFKNNQAYDRMWEARKIWGAIVNDSRTWGIMVDGFITNFFSAHDLTADDLKKIKTRLIYRHIAWLYTHRFQLLKKQRWELHLPILASDESKINATKGYYVPDSEKTDYQKKYLSEVEYQSLNTYANQSTQLLHLQSEDLKTLRQEGLIDDFRHITLENELKAFFDHQGKNERIKNFPLPRQYANVTSYITWTFVLLLPFSMAPEVVLISEINGIVAILTSIMVGWIFIIMEDVGNYSENPFQNRATDIPMMSINRAIEIDLLQMLGETDIPEPIKAIDGVLD